MTDLITLIRKTNPTGTVTAPQEDGSFSFALDEEFSLRCSQLHDDVIFEAVMNPQDIVKKNEFLQELMSANIAHQKTSAQMLCYSPKDKAVILYLRRPLRGLDSQDIEQIFAQFRQSIAFWRNLKERML